VPIALFSVTADESFFVGDALRKLAEHLGGEGLRARTLTPSLP
jgi:hypothetical protein